MEQKSELKERRWDIKVRAGTSEMKNEEKILTNSESYLLEKDE